MGTQDAAGLPPLDLLDEHWFFHNSLRAREKPPQRPPKPPFPAAGRRLLLRTPSLPPPRRDAPEEREDGVEEPEEDLNWSSVYEGVLGTRIACGGGGGGRAALRRAPSMPVPMSAMEDGGRDAEAAGMTEQSPPKLRYSYSSLESHCHCYSPRKDRTPRTGGDDRRRRPLCGVRSLSASHQPVVHGGSSGGRRSSALEEKKWKSSSDLESIEVQGFRDLGFVFDEEELKESLAGVLPGLRGDGGGGGGGDVRRPYLSEAWRAQPPAPQPPAIRLAPEKTSAAEVKDQIRMWAQAVACNVRQER